MPIREARSPVNQPSKEKDDRNPKHPAVYGNRSDAAPKSPTPPRGSAPGELIDGQITISKGANQ
jgi:hypothetical protein